MVTIYPPCQWFNGLTAGAITFQVVLLDPKKFRDVKSHMETKSGGWTIADLKDVNVKMDYYGARQVEKRWKSVIYCVFLSNRGSEVKIQTLC